MRVCNEVDQGRELGARDIFFGLAQVLREVSITIFEDRLNRQALFEYLFVPQLIKALHHCDYVSEVASHHLIECLLDQSR
jgi:hypothetical protein